MYQEPVPGPYHAKFDNIASPPPEKTPKPGINIYGVAAVNPYKLSIAAEELGITYNYIQMDFQKADNQSDWYKAINPNGRMPAIVHVKEDGTSTTIFESGPCLLYLVSEFDKDHKLSYSFGTAEYWTQLSWLSWQTAGYGPMMGQACHFNRYVPDEPVPYGSWRYTAECRRLHSVLDKQLATHPFVTGDKLTIVDIAIFIFAHSAAWAGIDITEFPQVKAWVERLLDRPAFQKGLQIPVLYPFSDAAVSNKEAPEFYKFLRKFGSQMFKSAHEEWNGVAKIPVLPSDHANLNT